jgi:hypothetical protein
MQELQVALRVCDVIAASHGALTSVSSSRDRIAAIAEMVVSVLAASDGKVQHPHVLLPVEHVGCRFPIAVSPFGCVSVSLCPQIRKFIDTAAAAMRTAAVALSLVELRGIEAAISSKLPADTPGVSDVHALINHLILVHERLDNAEAFVALSAVMVAQFRALEPSRGEEVSVVDA